MRVIFEVEAELDEQLLEEDDLGIPQNWPDYIENEICRALGGVAGRYDAVFITVEETFRD